MQDQPTVHLFDLLAAFDALADKQSGILADALYDAGIPDTVLPVAQAELAVALAGLRAGLAGRSSRIRTDMERLTKQELTDLPAWYQQELEDNLRSRLAALPSARAEARRHQRPEPTIDEAAERAVIDRKVATFIANYCQQVERELETLWKQIDHAITTAPGIVAAPYIARHARLRQEMDALCNTWNTKRLAAHDYASPSAIAAFSERMEDRANTFRKIDLGDGKFTIAYPAPTVASE